MRTRDPISRLKIELVDRLIIESFANEDSVYFINDSEKHLNTFLDKFRGRLRWHIGRSLSPRQRDVLRYYLSGKKEREIARILGIKQQVVNIYKHRAIRKLHKILAS